MRVFRRAFFALAAATALVLVSTSTASASGEASTNGAVLRFYTSTDFFAVNDTECGDGRATAVWKRGTPSSTSTWNIAAYVTLDCEHQALDQITIGSGVTISYRACVDGNVDGRVTPGSGGDHCGDWVQDHT